eukprot:8158017-Pyramimonas_sp.AAC.2
MFYRSKYGRRGEPHPGTALYDWIIGLGWHLHGLVPGVALGGGSDVEGGVAVRPREGIQPLCGLQHRLL